MENFLKNLLVVSCYVFEFKSLSVVYNTNGFQELEHACFYKDFKEVWQGKKMHDP